MLISKAYASATMATTDAAAAATTAMAQTPTATEAFAWNMGLVLVLVILFYVLMIMPQQRRFKEHTAMLAQLKKGDKVITGGGLLGKVDKIVNDEEIVVDLGGGMKVTALRSTISTKNDVVLKGKPANDAKASKDTKEAKESSAADE